ncbi:TPA: hypothetical protein L1L44_004777 [Escherichia coli]|nr:hypothetical protein [Escherichia coli]
MHNHEIQTIAIFSAQYKNIEDAENAGALYSVDIEYPMTLNDLSRLCADESPNDFYQNH